MGGKAHCQRVIARVGQLTADKLSDFDWQTISDGRTIRWENNVHWARNELVKSGLLLPMEKRRYWEISPAGRTLLEESKKSIAEPQQPYLAEELPLRTETKPLFIIGQSYHRQKDLHDKYGGNRQSGIAPCANYPIVFLFSSPSGKDSDYHNGTVSQDTYIYSGEGAIGNMEMTGGNRAILNHLADGRELHLFKQENSGLYQYVGQFEYAEHAIVESEDSEGNLRKAIQFTLAKV